MSEKIKIEIDRKDDPKYTTIKDYELTRFTNAVDRKRDWKPTVPITVAYIIWGQPAYVAFSYLSMLSQIIYTDILDCNVVVVTDEKLYGVATSMFDHLGVTVKSIDTTHKKLNKYSITEFSDLRNSDLLLVVDCDSFIYGNQTDIYRKLHSRYMDNSTSFPVLMCSEVAGTSVFRARRPHLAKRMYDDNEYIDWFVDNLDLDKDAFIREFVDVPHWHLSCVIGYDKNMFSTPDWFEYSNKAREMDFWCDETIYLAYAYKMKKQVSDLSYVPGFEYVFSHNVQSFLSKEHHNSTGIVHPLHGSYGKDMRIVGLYDEYQEKFNSYYINAHICGGWRNILPQYTR